MVYVKRGPFVDSSPTGPYIDAAYHNGVEAALVAATSTLVAPAPSGDTTGATDTAALQPLLSQAQTTAGTLALQAGTYYITALTTTQSFNQPRLIGQGIRQTVLTVVGSGIGVTYVGGSGQVSGGLIADLTLTSGSVSAGTGIELAGPIGVKVSRVRFMGTLATGLRFHNRDIGSFTEFCVAEDCAFESSVTTHVEYKRTNGNDSFHGTGLRNATGVQDPNDTIPKIVVGANCKVYNAPLDGNFFLNSTATYAQASSSLPFTTHGTIRIESNSGTAGRRFMTSTAQTWYHAGHATYLTQNTTLGGTLVEQVQANNDGSITVQLKPYETRVQVGTGTSNLTQFSAQGSTYLVGVTLVGPNYEYNYLLHVYRLQAANGGTVTQLANPRAFNSSGWGGATFAIDGTSNQLTITNASYPATGVFASVAVSPLNLRNSGLRFAG